MTHQNFDIRSFLKHLTTSPGVYRMLDLNGVVLYVGKANNLKQRVSSYFNQPASSVKNKSLVSQIHSIEVSVTRTETEALLLESSLIKAFRPKYNVLMRDDKTYPYIYISSHAEYPSIKSIRSKNKPEVGECFGPYPNTLAVRESIQLIQKLFKIRNCTDAYFNARTRPCLQYQIKRCSAPCMKYINAEEYQQALQNARLFLQGKNQQILNDLISKMQTAVLQLAFEEAAVIRDQIKKLRLIQEQQEVMHTEGFADVIAIEIRTKLACVQLVRVRDGQIVAHENFFPTIPNLELSTDELIQHVFSAFIMHYYFSIPSRIPALLITGNVIHDVSPLQQTLSDLRGNTCKIETNPRGKWLKWWNFATNNITRAFDEYMTSVKILLQRYHELKKLLNLAKPIRKMECFDISHTQGNSTVASCVVFDENGPCKKLYRYFNIKGVTLGDDYAAMEQALTRRFKRALQTLDFPDVLVIDGGLGQWRVAQRVLESLQISDITIVGIAKGPGRKAGLEKLIFGVEPQEIVLPEHSPALHLLQHIRDESHRFALKAHRKKRLKVSLQSALTEIPGVGLKRAQALLMRFGSVRAISTATVEEIAKVKGVGLELARQIYGYYHEDNNHSLVV